MKIKCTTTKVASLPDKISKNYQISYDAFFLKEGKEYIVYALRIYLGYIWYCISDEIDMFYPCWNPSTLFEISDNRLSRYWIFSTENEEDQKKSPFFSFPEWANDPYFYGELIEGNSGDANAVIFRKYKELMDLEFPDASISEIAQIGDDEWLICPSCIDGWKTREDRDALVRCPVCRTVYNNPRYKNEWPHLPTIV